MALAVESARGEAARGTRAGFHRTCEMAASRRGSTESSAPQKPIPDRRRPSAIRDFFFFPEHCNLPLLSCTSFVCVFRFCSSESPERVGRVKNVQQSGTWYRN